MDEDVWRSMTMDDDSNKINQSRRQLQRQPQLELELPTSAPSITLPMRPCHTPGCPNYGSGGRCKSCASRFNARRPSAWKRGYDDKHAKLRVECFVRDAWKCGECGWEPDIVRMMRQAELDLPPTARVLAELRYRKTDGRQHLHADHKVRVQDAPELSRELDNYQTLCDRCHDAKTLAETRREGGLK